jgi:biopolymer transport protein ExbD
MIRFTCTSCGKRLKADDSHAGRTIACPKCRAPIKVPSAVEALLGPAGPAPPVAAATAPPQGTPPASEHAVLLVPPRQKKHEDLIDMTAMVDIVFFLLLFFMITSLQPIAAVIGLPTPQAQASSAVSVSEIANDPNYVTVTIYEDDTVWIEDQEVFGAQDLRVRLRDAKREDDLLTGMLVVGSPEASHGTFVSVLDAGADAGLTELMFSVPDQLEVVDVGG